MLVPMKHLCTKEGVLAVVWRDHDDRIDGYAGTPPQPIDSNAPWVSIARGLFHIDDIARRTSGLMESLGNVHVHSLIDDATPLGFVVGDHRAMVVHSKVIDLKVMVLVRKGDETVTKSLQRMVRKAVRKAEKITLGDSGS